jgi:ATP-dependent exoDNAse (exonuclease V) alpha subunit
MPGQLKKAEMYRKADGIPEEVKLVVGAQVVVTYNLSTTVVNGSQGSIISMNSNEIVVSIVGGTEVTIGYISYKSPEDMNVYEAKTIFSFLPIRLSYASTIHKLQGSSLTLLEVDLSKVFIHGQTYTALSRVTALKGIIIKGLSRRAFICDPTVKRFYGVE